MQQGGRSYTPNFYITINGYDFTKFTRAWQLNDVDDGISTITVTLVNPDGVISGYIRTETELTLRYGYYDGSMSKPVTMKIKDLTEKYPTKHGSEIIVTAYDGTERLVGLTHAGNSTPDMKLEDAIKSLGDGVKLKMDIQAKGPDKPPEKIPLHNMSSHSAVRWIMGHMKCTKEGGGGGEDNPIDGQKEYDAGSGFKSAESVTGDRNPRSMLEAKKKELADIWIKNNKKKAGDSVITGRLEVVGHPGLEAKKSITINNVGEQASGKWYVRKSSQKYDTGSGYHTILDLLRASVGKDGKKAEQPVVLYAKIYEKDTAFVGCRDIDAESQATFTYGQPEENGEYLVIDFQWSIKVQGARAAGEAARVRGWAINEAKKLQTGEAPKTGSWNTNTQPPPSEPSGK